MSVCMSRDKDVKKEVTGGRKGRVKKSETSLMCNGEICWEEHLK